MCTLHTYTNKYMPRFSPSRFFGPYRCLIPTTGLKSKYLVCSVCVCVRLHTHVRCGSPSKSHQPQAIHIFAENRIGSLCHALCTCLPSVQSESCPSYLLFPLYAKPFKLAVHVVFYYYTEFYIVHNRWDAFPRSFSSLHVKFVFNSIF